MEELNNNQAQPEVEDTEVPLDKNVRLMSPTRMVVRRFFRSRLSIIGLIMVVGLFLFSFVGPLFYADNTADYSNDAKWGEIELDESGKTKYATGTVTYTVDGVELKGMAKGTLEAGDEVTVTYLPKSGYVLSIEEQ